MINKNVGPRELFKANRRSFEEKRRYYDENKHLMSWRTKMVEEMLLENEQLFFIEHSETSESNDDSIEELNLNFMKKQKTLKFPIIEEIKPKLKNHKKYACTFIGCDKEYTSSFGLKYHLKKGHLSEKLNVLKPFSCKENGCNKTYKNSNGLKYHMKIVHGNKQWA